jgi:hypothetical protein
MKIRDFLLLENSERFIFMFDYSQKGSLDLPFIFMIYKIHPLRTIEKGIWELTQKRQILRGVLLYCSNARSIEVLKQTYLSNFFKLRKL